MPEPAVQDVLERLRDEAERLFQARDVRFTAVRAVDSEASRVMKVAVSGATDVEAIYVKVFKPKEGGPSGRETACMRVVREFEVTSRLYDAMATVPGFAVARPLACFPEHLAMVTAAVGGETLSALLERRAAWWPSQHSLRNLGDVLSDVGGWLRAFQTIDPPPGRFSLREMRAYIDVRLRRLMATHPPVLEAHHRDRVLRYFDETATDVEAADLRMVLTHADLAPSNVLVREKGVAVIDFAMVAPGSVFMDVARLYTQLEFLTAKPKFRPATVQRLQDRLLEGFDHTLRSDRPLFRLFSLQHLLCHMSNIARNPAPPLSRLYNRHQLRLRQRWLRTFAA
jgi:tRNA A-37 threonylcarbamoyl transferase component Bud32